MKTIFLIVLAFLCGSLPFSVWIGQLFIKKDIRQAGDANPGATNVFRSGSTVAGLLALILDISKGAVPVGMAYFNLGMRGVDMVLIAAAPILGHVFSPFLHFRGGKAIAVSFGVWIGLSIWKIPLVAVTGVLIGMVMITSPGWSVLLALAAILITLLARLPDPLLMGVWCVQVLILTWTHRHDLRQGIHPRPWLASLLVRRQG